MAKIKGGLGESSLIEDLTKPISFHISESLEPPPAFDRRNMNKEKVAKQPAKKPFPQLILEKAISASKADLVQIVFHVEGAKEALLLENTKSTIGDDWKIVTVKGIDGEYLETSWKDSIFSGFDVRDVLDRQTANICSIEVMTAEDFINFSSMDDFFEWLEISSG